MKFSRFEELMNDKGYLVDYCDGFYEIVGDPRDPDNCRMAARISENKWGVYCIYQNPDDPAIDLDTISVIYKFAHTAIESRKDESKKYIQVIEKPHGYFNLNTESSLMPWTLDTNTQISRFQTAFTDAQIEEWGLEEFDKVEAPQNV